MRLGIDVTFTAGHFHGSEWPPSPARLFQALIAATHRGSHGLFHAPVRDAALRWLESQNPPEILAPVLRRELLAFTNFVPNNDNGVGEHIRTAKSMARFAMPEGTRVVYRWKTPTDEKALRHAEIICAMVPLITYLGRTVDQTLVRAEMSPTEADDVIPSGERILFKAVQSEGGQWIVPAPGFLRLCQERFPRSVSEQAPDFTNSRQVDYVPEGTVCAEVPTALFELRRLDGRLLAFEPSRLREPAGMVRHAMQQWVRQNPAMVTHYTADRIAQLVSGHKNGGSSQPCKSEHVAVVPLPSLNAAFTADGWIRRVAVFGHGFDTKSDRELFSDLVAGLSGARLTDGGRVIGQILPVSTERQESLLSNFGHRAAASGGRVWRSFSPIVLSGYTRRGRTVEACILRSLVQQGFKPEEIDSIAAFTGPIVPRSQPARAYRVADHLASTPRHHAEIIFQRPVRGPLVIGRGRFNGLGLMVPWPDEPNP